jgi:hypothetical protein
MVDALTATADGIEKHGEILPDTLHPTSLFAFIGKLLAESRSMGSL